MSDDKISDRIGAAVVGASKRAIEGAIVGAMGGAWLGGCGGAIVSVCDLMDGHLTPVGAIWPVIWCTLIAGIWGAIVGAICGWKRDDVNENMGAVKLGLAFGCAVSSIAYGASVSDFVDASGESRMGGGIIGAIIGGIIGGIIGKALDK